MKEVKIDSFEMKFDAEREREILHSLEILMLQFCSCSDNLFAGRTNVGLQWMLFITFYKNSYK